MPPTELDSVRSAALEPGPGSIPAATAEPPATDHDSAPVVAKRKRLNATETQKYKKARKIFIAQVKEGASQPAPFTHSMWLDRESEAALIEKCERARLKTEQSLEASRLKLQSQRDHFSEAIE